MEKQITCSRNNVDFMSYIFEEACISIQNGFTIFLLDLIWKYV